MKTWENNLNDYWERGLSELQKMHWMEYYMVIISDVIEIYLLFEYIQIF
jgi:hypothetical protein